MPYGYVYILFNPLMDGIVKIGSTTQSSEKRAIQISKGTGVPVAYQVVYEEHVSDCRAVEQRLHQIFVAYRINPNREFFRIPLKEAIRALQQVASEFKVSGTQRASYQSAQAVEIFPRLYTKYSNYLRPEIKSVMMVQRDGVCFLEITSHVHPNSRDERIECIDLEFISEGGRHNPMFSLQRPVQENAEKFVNELDPYSIIMCTPLFTELACKEIAEQYAPRLTI